MIKRTIAISLLLAGLASPFVPAQRPHDEEGRRHAAILPPGKWWKMPRITEALALTPEQITKIETIWGENRSRLQELRDRMEKALRDFSALADNDSSKKEQILQQAEQIISIRNELGRVTLAIQLDIRDQLTARQRAELRRLREEWQDRDRPAQEGDRGGGRNQRHRPPRQGF